MPANPMDSQAIDEILARCLSVFARRGAEIRAELRAQYGIEEGDRRMSELAREAERALWPDKPTTPAATLSGEMVAVVSDPIPKPQSLEKSATRQNVPRYDVPE